MSHQNDYLLKLWECFTWKHFHCPRKMCVWLWMCVFSTESDWLCSIFIAHWTLFVYWNDNPVQFCLCLGFCQNESNFELKCLINLHKC